MFLTPDKKHFHHYFKKFGENKTLLYLIIFLVVPIFVYEKNLLPVYLIIFLTILYIPLFYYILKNDNYVYLKNQKIFFLFFSINIYFRTTTYRIIFIIFNFKLFL